MVSINQLFTFVLAMTKKYNIDSSHSEIHSMDVVRFADDIYRSQLQMFPYLEDQTNVIYSAAILHDMCDKKYMNQDEGIKEIEEFLQDKLRDEEIYYTKRIIETMSYSTVKKNGYPDLGDYQMAYHVVREADLLSAYDFDRCVTYQLNQGSDLTTAYVDALKLFKNRMFNYNTDKLLISDYSQRKSLTLTTNALKQMTTWQRILTKSKFM
jgi:HD superfamily phosphodiesterase